MKPIQFEAGASRAVRITKGEKARLLISLEPKPSLTGQAEEKQREILDEARKLNLRCCVRLDSDGTLRITDAWLAHYFAVDYYVQGEWEYDSGEVTTHDTVFNRVLE